MDKSRDGGSHSVCPTPPTAKEVAPRVNNTRGHAIGAPNQTKKEQKRCFHRIMQERERKREKRKHRTVSYPIPIHHHSHAFSLSFLFFQILSFFLT